MKVQDHPEFAFDLEAPSDIAMAHVIELIHRARDWLTCAQILDRLALPRTDSNKRAIRKIAEQSEYELITGQKGYKHIENATQDEINHFCNWMSAQADKMKLRAIKTRHRAHQLVG